MSEQEIKPGLQFRFVVADSNALWEVKTKKRNGVWTCVGVDEPIVDNGKTFSSDFAGTVKDFLAEDIRRALKHDDFWQSLDKQHDDFYVSLKVGSVVHYDNGFKNFVRCFVVVDENRKKVLQPFALVGSWRQYDLPHYNKDGTIVYPHYAKMIIDKETFTPNASNIYESPMYSRKGALNPGADQALDLQPPPQTKEEKENAILWRTIRECHNVMDGTNRHPFEIVLKMLSSLKEGIDEYMKAKQ